MMIKAKDLQPSQVIQVEYRGLWGWQKFCVEAIKRTETGSSLMYIAADWPDKDRFLDFSLDEEVG